MGRFLCVIGVLAVSAFPSLAVAHGAGADGKCKDEVPVKLQSLVIE